MYKHDTNLLNVVFDAFKVNSKENRTIESWTYLIYVFSDNLDQSNVLNKENGSWQKNFQQK